MRGGLWPLRNARCTAAAFWRCKIDTEAQTPAAERPVTHEELVRFFSVLSHDLKSPIFAVDGFSDLLLSDYLEKLDEEGQDFLRRIRSSAQYMKRVLDEMSHMVKLLARPNARKPTPLREVVEEVILKYNFQIEEGGVQVDLPTDLPVVNVDPEKIREAIGALVANAVFFNDQPKGERRMAIDCSSDGTGGVRFCVRDNGIGIDPRYANQVFELGGMSKLDKPRGGGPGYGLYLAKRLIESHGGELTAESVLGDGSTFCFTIPG
jgi:signal transduction histidine kinase